MNEKHKTAIVQIFSVVVLLVCVASVIYSLDSLKESYREAEAHDKVVGCQSGCAWKADRTNEGAIDGLSYRRCLDGCKESYKDYSSGKCLMERLIGGL